MRSSILTWLENCSTLTFENTQCRWKKMTGRGFKNGTIVDVEEKADNPVRPAYVN